ncbi:MAG: CgeB family protein [Terriglobales bacterium]
MKITIFGLTLSSSWGNGHATPFRAIVRALHRRGHRVTFYEKDVPYYARRRDFDHCDYCNLVLYDEWDQVRPQALREARASDVVVCTSYCPEGGRIVDDVLPLQPPLRVFYDLDTPITLQNLEQGDLEYLCRDQVGCFDLYLSFTGGRILDVLEQRWGARMARPVYGCVDPDVHNCVSERADLRCALSYMGTYAADRQHKLDALFLEPARRRPDSCFILAGSLYPRESTWPENVRLLEHVAPADHAALYSSSRLTLNITRDGMARYGYCPSGRFFEAAACGTPLITDHWQGLETFFSPGDELLVAPGVEDVLEALNAGDEELSRIAWRARERTLCQHTGDDRAREMLGYFEEARRPVDPASQWNVSHIAAGLKPAA